MANRHNQLSYYKSRYKRAKKGMTRRKIRSEAEANLSTALHNKFMRWWMDICVVKFLG